MRPLPNIIKVSLLLFFIDLMLILEHLKNSYFVLLGIFFLEHVAATVLLLVLAFIAVVAGYYILKRNKAVYWLSQAFALFFILNSLINLVLIVFISSDIAGFLHQRVFGEDVFPGFIVMQLILVLNNLLLSLNLKSSKRLLK